MSEMETMNGTAKKTLDTPPGIRCPCCRRCDMTIGTDKGRPALSCGACGTFVRLLQRHGDPAPAFDLDDVQADVPPAGAWWLAYVKGGDGIARPVALAPTLGSAWDGVLHCPLRGVIIIAPTDPPARVEFQRLIVEGPDRA